MGISDKIEAFILELMKQEDEEWLKLQRNELAQIFGCVPSQINYVISTRFSPDKGYIVRSRRGGGGCVQIRRIERTAPTGDTDSSITEEDAYDIIYGLTSKHIITQREGEIIKTALSDDALSSAEDRGRIRADILNKIIELTL